LKISSEDAVEVEVVNQVEEPAKKKRKKNKPEISEELEIAEPAKDDFDLLDPLSSDPYINIEEGLIRRRRKEKRIKQASTTDTSLFAGANLHEVPGYAPFVVALDYQKRVTSSCK